MICYSKIFQHQIPVNNDDDAAAATECVCVSEEGKEKRNQCFKIDSFKLAASTYNTYITS
jgi:hypothetical protein